MPRKSYVGLESSQSKQSQNGLRRSSRVSSTTSRNPSSVCPPSDSRRSINRPDSTAHKKNNNKRTRSNSISETEATKPTKHTKKQKHNPEEREAKSKKNKNEQNTPKSSHPNNSDSGSIIDLREDSGDEVVKTTPKKKSYDSILDFFGEPFHLPKDSVSLSTLLCPSV